MRSRFPVPPTLSWSLRIGVLILWATMLPGGAHAQSVPPGFNNALVMGGWQEPVGFTFDANGRWYVWEKRGIVWIVENGVRRAQPLIDISQEVGNWRDHGCLGFALDPAFLSNGRIYLMYTVDRHHLMNFGTGNYNANTDQYFDATIMRITRYTAIGPSFNTVDPASRFILLGETRKTGVPLLHESHSTGQLVFGRDGTLLASVGDGATYNNVDVGSDPGTYFQTALTDSIMRPAENVGAMRSQLLNSLSGKLLRLDPNTGNGVPSNPYYDPLQPRAPKSRVWALGLRNPYRCVLRPGTGSTDPAAGDPGSIYIGDVGWGAWEDLSVCNGPGMNFGWPLFEGMEANPLYMASPTANQDAPNPLFGLAGCTQQFFNFQDLLKQDTPDHTNQHPNPCGGAVQVPAEIPHFIHARPAIDWSHADQSRSGGYSGSTAVTFDLDAVGAPVPGPRFGGFASVGGTFITGLGWPVGYQNKYFHADYAGAWIKRFTFDAEDAPVSVANFGSALGAVVFLKEGPDGALWYVKYESNQIWKIAPIGVTNLPPVAVATQSVVYGPSPLSVTFNGTGSSDPENGALTYSWNFGNGNTATGPNPTHVFTSSPGVAQGFQVTLTVTDPQGATNSTVLLVSVNNTPPVPQITSFPDGHLYPPGTDTTYALAATVVDNEHSQGQMTWSWQTIFHHNTHTHPETPITTPTGTTVVTGEGCYTDVFWYVIQVTVTDPAGLSGTTSHAVYPRCSSIAPTAVILSSVSAAFGPFLSLLSGAGSADNGTIVSYSWNFGDGTTATGANVSKTFTEVGDYLVTLTVVDNDGLSNTTSKVITVLSPAAPQCVGPVGSIQRQAWYGISGSGVANLLAIPAFPDSPNDVNNPTSFQVAANIGNDFGTRMRGYIIPPTTGNYIFTAVSDDASQVYLSLNADPAYKQPICNVPGWTNQAEFGKYASQTSAPIALVAGRYYYVEMLHKEDTGGDHLSLWWQTPTNSNRVIVPGSVLAPWVDCGPSVRLRANLQGAYDPATGLMRDGLRANGTLPTTEPFTALGFTQTGGGGGETIAPAMLSTTGMNALVDWVLVELRNKNNPAVIVATKSALLQRDGDVVGTNGSTRLIFPVAADNYYVALRHRNHLGAMIATSVLLNANQRTIDLTSPALGTYGTDALATLTNGRRAFWSGNVLRDGVLKYVGTGNDRDPILTVVGAGTPTNTVSGYQQADVTLDGQVKYTGVSNDRDPIIVNLGGNTPNVVRTEQLP